MNSRRDFIKKTALASLLPFAGASISGFSMPKIFNFDDNTKLDVSLFSKHLQFLDYERLGEVVAEMGFSGVDLTVRKDGHVLPERVKTDLPIALAAIRKNGLKCDLISTNIESVNDPLDVAILESAAALKIKYYRPNWYKYKDGIPMEDSLIYYKEEIRKLAVLNKKLGIYGSYQNHTGISIGSSFWEVKKVLEKADPKYFGSQFDIRHFVVEGGFSWENALRLLQENINLIVLKDFKWGKVNGKWEAINVPIGEGMVDFDSYFKLLKKHKIKPPVSLHVEHDLGGAEKGNRTISVDEKVVFDAIKKDLQAIQQLWKQA